MTVGMTAEANGDVTVAERLQLLRDELTPAERRVVRALMADYPVAGLGPVAKLAAAAGVSAPTVVRLVTKLSFEGYADFQQSLVTSTAITSSDFGRRQPVGNHPGVRAWCGEQPVV